MSRITNIDADSVTWAGVTLFLTYVATAIRAGALSEQDLREQVRTLCLNAYEQRPTEIYDEDLKALTDLQTIFEDLFDAL